MHEILVFDGSYYCHRSYNRATEWITPDQFVDNDDWCTAVMEKCLEITLQSITIGLERYNAVGAIMPLDMDTTTFINNLKSFDVESAQDDKYKIINKVRRHLMMHLPNFGIVTCGIAGIEADDFGYLISKLGPTTLASILGLQPAEYRIRMMTKDKDWYQNITDQCVWTSGENFSEVTADTMREWYGDDYRLTYVSEQCFTRTKDGNIGIHGVGWKGAAKIMHSMYDKNDGVPYAYPRDEWKCLKEFKKVVEQYDQFLANWRNIDCEWIKYLQFPSSDDTVEKVMTQHMTQAGILSQSCAPKVINHPQWGQLAALCGDNAKLRTAFNRMSEYVSRHGMH
ncbi:PIN domain-like protein [Vibrio phage 1.031.O._10N.261.46.F8]|nr:PIN domain-like protein [Vibrio phage 1.031.O._10N.261.46.F8]